MEIGQFKEYGGHIGSIEYDPEDKTYYGKLLNIRDLVDYYADSLIALNDDFHTAVDDYNEFNEDLQSENPEKKPIYIVTCGDYDYAIQSVFKHRDKAERYCSCHSNCEIEEYVFDDDTIYTTFNVVTIFGEIGVKDSKRDSLNLKFETLTEEDDDWKDRNEGCIFDCNDRRIPFMIRRRLPEKYDEERIREKYMNAFYDITSEIRYMIAELSQMSEKEKDMKIRNDVLAAISSKLGIEKE